MNNRSSITALMSAFGRAFHTENEEYPVFRDSLAKELMTKEEYTAVQGYILSGADFFEPDINSAEMEPKKLIRKLINTHIAPSPLCRTAYTEQALKTAVLTGTRQYVILGAGLDTFAFREPVFLSTCKVFEVDHPLTQADKIERIVRAGWSISENVSFVPVDFTKESITECLIANGFDPFVKSFFSLLGVTYYLSADAIDKMLAALSELCADGSTLVFDYPDEHFFTAKEKRVQNTIVMARAGGETMKFSISYAELEKLLEKHGLLIYELLTPEEIQKNIIDSAKADMKAFEHVNYCLAVKKR
jgi:methyltransferase (TIGR00027 family)